MEYVDETACPTAKDFMDNTSQGGPQKENPKEEQRYMQYIAVLQKLIIYRLVKEEGK